MLKCTHIFFKNFLFNSTFYIIRAAFDSQRKIIVVSLKITTRMRSFKSDFFYAIHDVQITFMIIIIK